jgi:hypothetical protein
MKLVVLYRCDICIAIVREAKVLRDQSTEHMWTE